jgi:hypothetical protein
MALLDIYSGSHHFNLKPLMSLISVKCFKLFTQVNNLIGDAAQSRKNSAALSPRIWARYHSSSSQDVVLVFLKEKIIDIINSYIFWL